MKLLGCIKINNKGAVINGKEHYLIQHTEEDWKKELFLSLKKDYSKFYKMDALAKMAFIGVQLIKEAVNFQQFEDDEVALIFANKFSSYDDDSKYIESYTNKGKPSPSLFVYTLPNILTGEIAISEKWYGENIFFIEEKFNPSLYLDQINFYLRKESKVCLCGWVESVNGNEECILFAVDQSEGNITENELLNLYNQSI